MLQAWYPGTSLSLKRDANFNCVVLNQGADHSCCPAVEQMAIHPWFRSERISLRTMNSIW